MITIYEYEKYKDEYSLYKIDDKLYIWRGEFATKDGLFLVMEEVEDINNYSDNFYKYIGTNEMVRRYSYLLYDLLCNWTEYFDEVIYDEEKYKNYESKSENLKMFFISRIDLEEGRYNNYKEA